jgi:CheY-like chemotaxis protein
LPDLAAHLVRSGVLAPAAAARALAAARDGDVGSAALRLGLAPEAALARALADVHGCPAVDLSRSVVPCANLDAVSPELCRQRRVLPVSVTRTELVLAMADPDDRALADEVRFVTGRSVLRYAAVPAAIERTVDGVVREASRGAPAWRGAQAPALPDPAAAWVGVVHGAKLEHGADLSELASSAELVGLAGAAGATPFSAPSPARRERHARHAPPAAAPGSGDAAARRAGVGAGKLALVADASAPAREEAAALLAGIGCAVLQAPDGKTALDAVREARPDLVLLEALLPMTPGFEVCRAVKGDPVLRPTAVVLTSGAHRGTVAADAKAVFGADAFLEKPWRDDEVVRTATRLLLGGEADPAEQAARATAAAAWREGARLLRAGRVDEAIALLREAAAKDDLSPEAHHDLGVALARQGILFEAAAAFARAAELRPDVDLAHQALARTYEALGFRKSAREAWARAIEACADEERKGVMQARLARLLGM